MFLAIRLAILVLITFTVSSCFGMLGTTNPADSEKEGEPSKVNADQSKKSIDPGSSLTVSLHTAPSFGEPSRATLALSLNDSFGKSQRFDASKIDLSQVLPRYMTPLVKVNVSETPSQGSKILVFFEAKSQSLTTRAIREAKFSVEVEGTIKQAALSDALLSQIGHGYDGLTRCHSLDQLKVFKPSGLGTKVPVAFKNLNVQNAGGNRGTYKIYRFRSDLKMIEVSELPKQQDSQLAAVNTIEMESGALYVLMDGESCHAIFSINSEASSVIQPLPVNSNPGVKSCEDEKSLWSFNGSPEQAVGNILIDKNTIPEGARFFWLDYQGERVEYQLDSENPVLTTFTSHPWVIADAQGTCVGVVLFAKDMENQTFQFQPVVSAF